MEAKSYHSVEMIPLTNEDAAGDNGRKSSPASHDLCKFLAGLVAITLVVAALFTAGLFTGYGALCNPPACKCGAGGDTVAGKWGGEVVGEDGRKTIPVTEWLDGEMKAENIRENLRFGTVA